MVQTGIENENAPVSLEDIMRELEKDETEGAYHCSGPGFIAVCRVLSGRWKRNGMPSSLLMCELEEERDFDTEDAVRELMGCVQKTLRKSDAYTRHGKRQVLALLPDTGLAGADAVAETLGRVWRESGPGKRHGLRVYTSRLDGNNE